MVIVRLTGGLGNQMFQYAFFKKLITKGNEGCIDDFSFRKNHQHENLKLTDVFPNVAFQQASEKQVHALADVKSTLFEKVKNRLFGDKKSHIKAYDLVYHPQYELFQNDVYLDGYWQSEKYFKDIDPLLRHDFKFSPLPGSEHHELANQVRSLNSISIHVRKGKDFHSVSRKDVCNVDYYRKAVEAIREKVSDPVFYVFSDNLAWCKENLDFIQPIFAEGNDPSGLYSYLDMQLMSLCRHNIIANSSYSWWSAWLNNHAGKQVIAPETWFNKNTIHYNIRDLIPASWRTI